MNTNAGGSNVNASPVMTILRPYVLIAWTLFGCVAVAACSCAIVDGARPGCDDIQGWQACTDARLLLSMHGHASNNSMCTASVRCISKDCAAQTACTVMQLWEDCKAMQAIDNAVACPEPRGCLYNATADTLPSIYLIIPVCCLVFLSLIGLQ